MMPRRHADQQEYREPWVAPPTNRFLLDVVTVTGRAAAVEFRIRRDDVEVWHHEHCRAVIDREMLRAWLHAPAGDLSVDEVTLGVDRMVDREGRVAVTLDDVVGWTVDPVVLMRLRDRI